jgi:hypothetical protein
MWGRTVSHYRILENLGGVMLVADECEDSRLGRSIALEFMLEHLAPDGQALTPFRVTAHSAKAHSSGGCDAQ